MKRTLLLGSITVGLIAGCAGSPTPIPDANSSAAVLYAEKCGACHAVPHPKRHTTAQWQHMLARMEERMAEIGMTALSTEERETLLSYLQNNAR